MDRGAHPDYSGWVVTHGDPPARPVMLDPPRRCVADVDVYAGHRVRLQLYAIARTKGWVCVQQDVGDRAPWNAWIPARQVTPV